MKFKDCYNYIRLRFFNRSHLINTKLPKGNWYDKDTLMFHGMMELLVDCVEKEEIFSTWQLETDQDKIAAKEISDIYNWYKMYIKNEENMGYSFMKYYENNYNIENEMMIRLIKIRNYLWT